MDRHTNYKLLILLMLLALLFYGIYGYSQQISVSSEVDKGRLTRAECLTLTITICGEMKKTPRVELPELKDFALLSKKSSHNISIKEGKARYSSEFDFILKPKSVGKLTIGPVKVKHKGRIYRTQPIIVEVTPGEPAPERPRPPVERELPKLEGGIIL